jgi:hypothetical protein
MHSLITLTEFIKHYSQRFTESIPQIMQWNYKSQISLDNLLFCITDPIVEVCALRIVSCLRTVYIVFPEGWKRREDSKALLENIEQPCKTRDCGDYECLIRRTETESFTGMRAYSRFHIGGLG